MTVESPVGLVFLASGADIAGYDAVRWVCSFRLFLFLDKLQREVGSVWSTSQSFQSFMEV